jgi:L-threonylcarbamoyladenylate synthase
VNAGAPRWLDRDRVLAVLAGADGVAILPTDTVPGLHARIDRPRALDRLSALKQRPPDQSYVVLCADVAQARGLVADLPPPVRDYLDRLWPGPFSAVLVAAAGLPLAVVAPSGTVAVRIPGWPPLRELLRRSGPLASTSANPSGTPPATDLEAAAARFPELPLWRAAGPTGPTAPSALIDLTGDAPRVLRPGPQAPPSWGEDV